MIVTPYTIKEAAEAVGRTESQIRTAIKVGDLGYLPPNKKTGEVAYRIKPEVLRKWAFPESERKPLVVEVAPSPDLTEDTIRAIAETMGFKLVPLTASVMPAPYKPAGTWDEEDDGPRKPFAKDEEELQRLLSMSR